VDHFRKRQPGSFSFGISKEALRIVPFVGRGLDAVANDLLAPGFVAYSKDCPTEYQHFSYYADC
jgi:hypothetical protein